MYTNINRFLSQLESLFSLYPYFDDNTKLIYAQSGFQSGPAATWWHSMPYSQRPHTWDDFVSALSTQFLGPHHQLLVHGRLRSLKQSTSLQPHVTLFESLCRQLHIELEGDNTTTVALDFIRTLRDPLKEKVLSNAPKICSYEQILQVTRSADATMALARVARDDNRLSPPPRSPYPPTTPSPHNKPSSSNRGNYSSNPNPHNRNSSSSSSRSISGPRLHTTTTQQQRAPIYTGNFPQAPPPPPKNHRK
jgi:hypothetical protein